MSKHSCKKYDFMIDDYIDGLLSDDDVRKLEAHLSTCEDCRQSLRFSIALRNMTRSAALEFPVGLHERIIESVNEDKKAKNVSSKRKIFRLGAISAACMLLCLCCTAVFLMLPGNRKSESKLPPDCPMSEAATDPSAMLPSFNGSVNAPEKGEDEGYTYPVIEEPALSSPEYDENSPEDAAPTPDETCAEPEEVAPNDKNDYEYSSTDAPANPAPDVMTNNSNISDRLENAADAEKSETHPVASPEGVPSARPGGEEITLALLIVSGLLAVASFIAFLISLSSIRTHSSNKENKK